MITGSIVALVTPMHEGGDIDWPRLSELVEWHVESGTAAIVPVGTTGESATLNVEEHAKVIKYVVDVVAGRIPVIAGTGGNATQEAIELTARAKEVGADQCLLVTPYYNKPSQEGLFQHYKAISEAVDIPQLLYNVPGRTACDMQASTVARLAELPGIIGIKEATGDLGRSAEIRDLCGNEFAIYSGDDATSCDLMLEGANGTISVSANVVPGQVANMANAAVAGDAEQAKALDAPMRALHDKLFLESNPIPVKWALNQMGKIDSGIRLPLTEFAAEYHEELMLALREAGAMK